MAHNYSTQHHSILNINAARLYCIPYKYYDCTQAEESHDGRQCDLMLVILEASWIRVNICYYKPTPLTFNFLQIAY